MTMPRVPQPPGTPGQGSGRRNSGRGSPILAIVGFSLAALLAIGGGIVAAQAFSDDTTAEAQPSGRLTPPTSGTPTTDAAATSVATSAAPEATEIHPTGATATNVRDSVDRLRCGGRGDFFARYLIDGDPQTGWGASEGDGAGQSIKVDLGAAYALEQVGITPGFLKNGPRFDQGCSSVSAFGFNRHITAVRYTFDDGSSKDQTLGTSAAFEMVDVSATTRYVNITILGTDRWGTDNDTIISDARFVGSPA